MEEEFFLPIQYKGQALELPCVFRKLGYTYKIAVRVSDKELLFEPDEEGSFRAALANIQDDRSSIDLNLLSIIIKQLTAFLK